jgi:membrane protein DedA with SNARE-associated domain
MVRNWGNLDITDANALGILLFLPGWLALNSLRPWAERLPESVAIPVLAIPLICANALAWYLVVKVKRHNTKSV